MVVLMTTSDFVVQSKDDLKTAIEDSAVPAQLQGEIRLQLRKKKHHRFRKYHAVLAKGFLRLFTNDQEQHYKYQIDLAKILVKEEKGAVLLEFRVETRVLIPVNEKDLDKWKNAMMRHQQYRKTKLKIPSFTSPTGIEGSSDRSGSSDSVSTANDFSQWETYDVWARTIDKIQQTQGFTLEMLDRISMKARQMRIIAEELNELAENIMRQTLDKETRTKIAESITSALNSISNMECSMNETFDVYPFACEVDATSKIDIPQSSYEFDDSEFLGQDSRVPMMLHSLKATINVEQKKARVIRRAFESLGKKILPLLPQRSDTTQKSVALPSLSQQRQEDKTQQSGDFGVSPRSNIEHRAKSSSEAPSANTKPRRERRKVLPAQQSPSESISFAALGRMIVQRTGVPITHYEPLTALQLLCEELRHSKLLNRACTKAKAEERMVYVAAFAVSPYPNSTGRFRKFFNPLLGETYEYEQEDFKYHGEQVCHHPAVSAVHAEGNGWTWFQTFSAEITWNAWAQTCEFAPERPVRLQLNGEDYRWNKITTRIENLIYAPEQRKLYHEGTIKVKCSNGVSATIHVDKNKELSGEVVDAKGAIFCRFSGRWDEHFTREMNSGEKEQLIVVGDTPLHPQYFGFSDFTMGLNELYPEDRASLPPTDSRLRPDVRNLEDGKLDDAVAYKYELEKAQRARAIDEKAHKPLWFVEKMDEFSNTDIYVSNGKYWQAKGEKFEQQKKNNAFIPIFNVSITR
uniref:PH domain-containing protein n=1 Tax=Haemonchus contortus TaxID=6289 RepID=A0A7I5E847_HAECO